MVRVETFFSEFLVIVTINYTVSGKFRAVFRLPLRGTGVLPVALLSNHGRDARATEQRGRRDIANRFQPFKTDHYTDAKSLLRRRCLLA